MQTSFDRRVRLYSCSIHFAVDRKGIVLETVHNHGHTRHSTRDIMPSGAAQEDTNQLNRSSLSAPDFS